MVLITTVIEAYKPTYNWGGPHCMEHHFFHLSLHFADGGSAMSETLPFTSCRCQIASCHQTLFWDEKITAS